MQSQHAGKIPSKLSVGEAASLLGVSADTLKRWERDGRVRSYRTPTNHRRFELSEIVALLKTAEASALSGVNDATSKAAAS
ncbi:DNA binding domain, excisionase family [Mycobacteroides abscessus subsp. abscessus]|nr:DNA binding domain, excisionase family [Mycobacteroides abscessus subsp. abscessus]SHQ39503.1 DNA binding domain, excisionase family [Mycobacteroides abscessus subsp. abscessus]SHQ52482.1 DNA binding domain, excisionase family [Mycobacteroides abscessus subsp. abscessus]SHQ53533.1 DNA binding domain, excisionase family [Mycobacteroides abscessus subsp. abscessus]SHR31140.1 DNA binding domain, excisionase family [Mycobacteroides abscessus subsp. abscessus]